MWSSKQAAWAQIVAGKPRSSSRGLQIEVQVLSKERQLLQEAKIEATETNTAPGVISWFDVKDPEGNSMRRFQVLTTGAKATGKRD